jgi:iron-sulfur cluster assembly protein
LAMALDEPKDTDTVYDVDGYKYLVDRDFLEKSKPIKVDFLNYGFNISSSLVLAPASACSSCGSSGNSCG